MSTTLLCPECQFLFMPRGERRALRGLIGCPECGHHFVMSEPPSLEELATASLASSPPPRDANHVESVPFHDDADDDYLPYLTGTATPNEWLGRPVGSLAPVAFDDSAMLTAMLPTASSRFGRRSAVVVGLAVSAGLVLAFTVGLVGGRGLAAMRTEATARAVAPSSIRTADAPVAMAATPAPALPDAPTELILPSSASDPLPPVEDENEHGSKNDTGATRPSAVAEASPRVVAHDTVLPVPNTEVAEAEPFNREAATAALANATTALHACYDADIGVRAVRVAVTFAPTGRVNTALLEPGSYGLGTPVATCVVRELRTMTVPPFSGDTTTIHANAHLVD